MMTTPTPGGPGKKTTDDLRDSPLNPGLQKEVDRSFTADQDGSTPMDTISVKKDEGRAWPMIWAIATIVSIIIVLLIFIF